MFAISFILKELSKISICAERSFNSWKITRISQGQQNRIGKGALGKNRRAKNTQVNECPNRCLINQG